MRVRAGLSPPRKGPSREKAGLGRSCLASHDGRYGAALGCGRPEYCSQPGHWSLALIAARFIVHAAVAKKARSPDLLGTSGPANSDCRKRNASSKLSDQ